MTESDQTKSSLMVRAADLLHRALKLARRRWYVTIVLMLIGALPVLVVAWRYKKVIIPIKQLRVDNLQVNDWKENRLIIYNSYEPSYVKYVLYLSPKQSTPSYNTLFRIIFSKHLILILNEVPINDISALKGLPLKGLYMTDTKISDISSLKGMPLQDLYRNSTQISDSTQVSDISVLKGMPLSTLTLAHTQITDISVLKGLPLTSLDLTGTQISDISVLKGLPLESLILEKTQVSNISVLKGMPLMYLNLQETQVTDISVLKEMPLSYLYFHGTKISDISVLKGMAFYHLLLPKTAKDINFLKTVKTMQKINGRTTSQFWIEYDKTGVIPDVDYN